MSPLVTVALAVRPFIEPESNYEYKSTISAYSNLSTICDIYMKQRLIYDIKVLIILDSLNNLPIFIYFAYSN